MWVQCRQCAQGKNEDGAGCMVCVGDSAVQCEVAQGRQAGVRGGHPGTRPQTGRVCEDTQAQV